MGKKKSQKHKAALAVQYPPPSPSTQSSPEVADRNTANLPIRTRAQIARPSVVVPKPRKRDIVTEFSDYFGNETVLANWQRLCHDLAIDADLSSVKKCRLALKGVWVNIYDFIDAKQSNQIVKRFKSQQALSRYTIKTERIFPKKRAKQGGPVRALLAHIFN